MHIVPTCFCSGVSLLAKHKIRKNHEKNNADYYKLLKYYEEKTGEGIILNTSFNLHDDAIVWDPEAALHTFQNSDLDVLAIVNYLLKKD